LTSRRDARRTAIDILYQADVTGEAPDQVLVGWGEAGREIPPFAVELVNGVAQFQPEIDLLLEEHADGWTVARMTALDRTILRVGVQELLHRPDVPPSAAISEAVEATAELSSDESRRFVNGVLGRIARELNGSQSGPAGAPAS
jgi:N utilization substance protein B